MSKTRFLRENRFVLNHSRCIVVVLSKELTTILVFIRNKTNIISKHHKQQSKHKQLKTNHLIKKQVINPIKKMTIFF